MFLFFVISLCFPGTANEFSLQKRIEHLHECVVKNDFSELQASITRRKLAVSKDDKGHGLLHKAVFYGNREIVMWLLERYPETAEVKDWVSLYLRIYVTVAPPRVNSRDVMQPTSAARILVPHECELTGCLTLRRRCKLS